LVVGDGLKMGLNGHTLDTRNLSDQLQIDRICLKLGKAAGRPLAHISRWHRHACPRRDRWGEEECAGSEATLTLKE
jgi:hypothetical protein